MSDAKKFPESCWPEMQKCIETRGVSALIELVNGYADKMQRLQLYAFGRMALNARAWEGKNFDDQIVFVSAGIEDARRQEAQEIDSAVKAKLEEWVNVLSYNHAADLCECWPGDTLPRERRHLEIGRDAALRCIELRKKLGKGPEAFAIAYWALGMHQLSLAEPRAAAKSFQEALESARQVARAKGTPQDVVPGGDYQIVLNTAFLGLARHLAGAPDGLGTFHASKQAFAQTDDHFAQQKEDAQFGMETLQVVETRFLAPAAGTGGAMPGHDQSAGGRETAPGC